MGDDGGEEDGYSDEEYEEEVEEDLEAESGAERSSDEEDGGGNDEKEDGGGEGDEPQNAQVSTTQPSTSPRDVVNHELALAGGSLAAAVAVVPSGKEVSEEDIDDMVNELRRGFYPEELVCLRVRVAKWGPVSRERLRALLEELPHRAEILHGLGLPGGLGLPAEVEVPPAAEDGMEAEVPPNSPHERRPSEEAQEEKASGAVVAMVEAASSDGRDAEDVAADGTPDAFRGVSAQFANAINATDSGCSVKKIDMALAVDQPGELGPPSPTEKEAEACECEASGAVLANGEAGYEDDANPLRVAACDIVDTADAACVSEAPSSFAGDADDAAIGSEAVSSVVGDTTDHTEPAASTGASDGASLHAGETSPGANDIDSGVNEAESTEGAFAASQSVADEEAEPGVGDRVGHEHREGAALGVDGAGQEVEAVQDAGQEPAVDDLYDDDLYEEAEPDASEGAEDEHHGNAEPGVDGEGQELESVEDVGQELAVDDLYQEVEPGVGDCVGHEYHGRAARVDGEGQEVEAVEEAEPDAGDGVEHEHGHAEPGMDDEGQEVEGIEDAGQEPAVDDPNEVEHRAKLERMKTGYPRAFIEEQLRQLEGYEEPSVILERIRGHAQNSSRRRMNAEVERFLDMMRKMGGGNITLAWRRRFVDPAGDGFLSFPEFCNALQELGFEGDVVGLWHKLQARGGDELIGTNMISLDAVDPEGAAVLKAFGTWCKIKFGGPTELFRRLDEDGSDSLTIDEFVEGLLELDFFSDPDSLPPLIRTPQLAAVNLYPLLDQGGGGCVTADQLLFLEEDKAKRARIAEELMNIREKGVGDINLEPLTRGADEFLKRIYMRATPAGGKHWSQVKADDLFSSAPAKKLKGTRRPKRSASTAATWRPSSLRDEVAADLGRGRSLPSEPAIAASALNPPSSAPEPSRSRTLPPLRKPPASAPSPHVLDGYTGWGKGGERIRYKVDTPLTVPPKESPRAPPPDKLRRQCYRQSFVPKLLPPVSMHDAPCGGARRGVTKSSSMGALAKAGARRQPPGGRGRVDFDPLQFGNWVTSRQQLNLFEHYTCLGP